MTPEPSTPLQVARRRLERIHRVGRRAAAATSRTPGATSTRAARPARRASGSPAPPPALSRRLRLAQLVLERRDPVGDVVDRLGADAPRPRARAQSKRSPHERVGRPPGDRLDAAHPRADAPLAGDDEAADLAAGPAVRAAAQLEAVVLDADRPDRLAVLLVEEGVGASLDRLRHRHERDGDGPVVADDAADLVLDRAHLVVGQRRGRTGSRSAGSPASRASRPGGPAPRPRCAARGGADACRCGCASCRRAGRDRRPPRRSRRPAAGRGACRGGRSGRRAASACRSR